MGSPLSELTVPNIPELIVRASPGKLERMVQDNNTDGRQAFAVRIKQAMRDAGYPDWGGAVRLARELAPSISARAVGKWLNGEAMPDTKRLEQIAGLLRVSVEWLLTGKSAEESSGHKLGSPINGTDVPIIEFATLADGDVRNHSRPAKMAVSWTICPVKHGPRTFAFKMPDNSMACATDQSIPAGHYVWIDPDQAEAAHDSPVLARLESGQHLVAQHMEQAGRRWLHLLNPAYPPVPPGTAFEIVGRVIFSGRER